MKASSSPRSTTVRVTSSRRRPPCASRRSSAPTSSCAWTSARPAPPAGPSSRRPSNAPRAGRPPAERPIPAPTRCSWASSRAGSSRSCAAAPPRSSSTSSSPPTPSAASPWANAATRCSASSLFWMAFCRRRSYGTSWASAIRAGILNVIARGVDVFDCVLPTRLARTGTALLKNGDRVNLRNAQLCGRPAAAGRHVRLPVLSHVQPVVPPASRQPEGDPCVAAPE